MSHVALVHAAVIVAGALLVSCTPASEELPPAGATGFTTEPNAAARGERVISDDGWTLRFTTLALSGSIYATARSGPFGGSSRSANWAWDASKVVSVFAPGLDVGPARVQLELRGNFFPPERYDSRRKKIGITPEVNARLIGPPDDGLTESGFGYGPSLVFDVTAERDGRSLHLGLALSTSYYVYLEETAGRAVEIREDAFTPVPVVIAPERLFTRDGQFLFDGYAIADAEGNDDGEISVPELRAQQIQTKAITTSGSGPGSATTRTIDLVDALVERVPTIVVYK